MIIHSTKLSTAAKVKAVYGGTTWISHSGYVLRGATSGVIANSATKTGGSDDAIVVKHNHYSTNRAQFLTALNGAGDIHYNTGIYDFVLAGTTTAETGEDGTNKNIPNYKSVYIWERTA